VNSILVVTDDLLGVFVELLSDGGLVLLNRLLFELREGVFVAGPSRLGLTARLDSAQARERRFDGSDVGRAGDFLLRRDDRVRSSHGLVVERYSLLQRDEGGVSVTERRIGINFL